jgi:hypothetical protein
MVIRTVAEMQHILSCASYKVNKVNKVTLLLLLLLYIIIIYIYILFYLSDFVCDLLTFLGYIWLHH